MGFVTLAGLTLAQQFNAGKQIPNLPEALGRLEGEASDDGFKRRDATRATITR